MRPIQSAWLSIDQHPHLQHAKPRAQRLSSERTNTVVLRVESSRLHEYEDLLSRVNERAERQKIQAPRESARSLSFMRIVPGQGDRVTGEETSSSIPTDAHSHASSALRPPSRLVPYAPGDDDSHGLVAIHEIELSCEVLRFNGWYVIASLDAQDAGVRVTHLSDLDSDRAIVLEAAARGFECDHCRSCRPRRSAYVLIDDQGEHHTIGTICLDDFAGCKTTGIRPSIDLVKTLRDFDSDNGGWKHAASAVSMIQVLSTAAIVIACYGFVSTSSTRQRIMLSTADRVREHLQHAGDPKIARMRDKDPQRWLRIAREAIEWAESIADDCPNEFEVNAKPVLRQPAVEFAPRYSMSMAVAAMSRYMRVLSAAPAPLVPGDWIGQVGESIEVVCWFSHSFGSNSPFGLSMSLILIDEQGRTIKLSTRMPIDGLEPGNSKPTRLRARVRQRGIYDGRRQTVIDMPELIEQVTEQPLAA